MKNDIGNTIDNKITIIRKQKWVEKQPYGPFKRLMNNISHEKTWSWLIKGKVKKEAESLQIEA